MSSELLSLAGHVSIDSGMCWLGDPKYCATPDAREHPAPSWEAFIGMQGDRCRERNVTEFDQGVCINLEGDGTAPVYIKRDQYGQILEARIVFSDPDREYDHSQGCGYEDDDTDEWDDEDDEYFDDDEDDWDEDDEFDDCEQCDDEDLGPFDSTTRN